MRGRVYPYPKLKRAVVAALAERLDQDEETLAAFLFPYGDARAFLDGSGATAERELELA